MLFFVSILDTSSTTSSSGKDKTNVQLEACCGAPPVKRTRRKLMDSPPPAQSPEQSSRQSPGQLLDSLSKELRPIVYTPEVCRLYKENCCPETVVKQVLHTASVQETNSGALRIQEPLKEINHKAITHNTTPECKMNLTVTLYENNTDSTDNPSSDAAEHKSQSTNSSSVLQRYLCLSMGLLLKYPSSSFPPYLYYELVHLVQSVFGPYFDVHILHVLRHMYKYAHAAARSCIIYGMMTVGHVLPF